MEVPKTFDQAMQAWQALTVGQKLWIAAGAAILSLTLWGFVTLFQKPSYVTLYTGLKPADAQALASRLAAKNIPYQLSPDGSSVLVPPDQLDASRLETASQGLPRSARLGFELFDTPNWAGSDFSEKVNYQRALEGELERTLQTLNDVEAVRVHLVMPHESLFTEQEREAKAAVIIKMRGGRLSEQEQTAIPQLVASAVDGLRPENVTVIDADSNTPLLHRRGEPYGSLELDEQLAKTLLRTLEPVLGAEHVRASVHVEYDMSSSENTEETYDPKSSVMLTQQKSEENAGSGGPAGVPGTASNVPGGTAPAAATAAAVVNTAETQSSRSESETYAISKVVRHTTSPAGRIHRIAAAVLVDDAEDASEAGGKKTTVRRKRTPEELKNIEQLSAAALGIDAQRGDVLAVQNLSFQEIPVEKPVAPTKVEVSRRLFMQWSGLLRYVGILALFLIVYLLILRPVKKQIVTSIAQIPGKIAHGAAELLKPTQGATAIAALDAADPSKRAAALKKLLTEKVKKEPAEASRLVQNWIRSEDRTG